ncbi:MAG: hypothetical protein U0457_15355 [Candidatus Sericytochromatia bacterium]
MVGINPQFVNEYKNLFSSTQNGKNVPTEEQIKKLVDSIKSGNNDPKAIGEFRDLIAKDKNISNLEKKVLNLIGATLDQKSLNTIIKDLESVSQKVKGILYHDSNPINDSIKDLMERGRSQANNAGERYKEDHNIKSKIREKASEINTGIKESIHLLKNSNIFANLVAKAIPTETKKAIMEQIRVVSNDEAGENELKTQLLSDKAEYAKESMEKDDCVGEVVRYMSKKGGLAINPKDFNSAEVTEAYLNSLNKNIKWDGINIAQQNKNGKLDQLLAGQERKALVVVGNHTFVLDGVEKDRLRVVDPANNNRTVFINKNNPGAAVFVIGQGDGNQTTGKIDKEKAIKEFSYDKDPNYSDTKGDSKEIRQFMDNLANPAFLNLVDKYATEFARNPNDTSINKLQAELKKFGIELNADELKAMAFKLTAKVGNTTPLNELKNLSKQDTTNFKFGIEYSDIPLSGYFIKTSPEAIIAGIKDLKAGRDGC